MRIRWRTVHRVWVTFGISAWILFVGYNLIAYQAWGVDPAVLRDGARVRVEEGEHTLRFLPRGEARGAGLLFFPGALVEPEAYAPLLYRVAEAGHPAVLVKLPLRAAPSASHEAEAVARAFAVLREPSLGTRWVVGGHSKGGKISVRAAAAAPERLAGLLLIGTSHPRRQDLSGLPLPVTKVYATRDGLASPEEVRAFAPNLPPDTRFVEIEGGNHAQFGWYGFQLGDRRATISRERQQDLLTEAVLAALRRAAPAR